MKGNVSEEIKKFCSPLCLVFTHLSKNGGGMKGSCLKLILANQVNWGRVMSLDSEFAKYSPFVQ